MKPRHPKKTGASLIAVMMVSAVCHGQTVGIRVDANVHVDVETIPTEQFWVTESPNLVDWSKHTFVDHSTSIDYGHPVVDRRFFRLTEVYGPIGWSSRPDMPAARDQFTGGVIDGKLCLFGGNGFPSGTDLSRLDIYDPATSEWTQGVDYNFGLEELSSAVVGGKLYVFGGASGSNTSTTLCYDPAQDAWSERAPQMTYLQQSTAIAYGDEILHLGGNVPESDEVSPTVQAYNTITDEWRYVTEIPEPLWAFAAGIHDDVIYLVGGFSGGSKHPGDLTPHNTVHRFDLLNEVWMPDIVDVLPRPVGFPSSSACPIVNGHLIIAGGGTTFDGNFTISNWQTDLVISNLVLVYDTEGNSFADNAPLADTFGNHLVLLAGDKLFVCGGNTGPDVFDDTPTSRLHVGAFKE